MFFSHDMSPECCWQIAVPPPAANLSETSLGASVCFLLTLGAALVYSSYTGETCGTSDAGKSGDAGSFACSAACTQCLSYATRVLLFVIHFSISLSLIQK